MKDMNRNNWNNGQHNDINYNRKEEANGIRNDNRIIRKECIQSMSTLNKPNQPSSNTRSSYQTLYNPKADTGNKLNSNFNQKNDHNKNHSTLEELKKNVQLYNETNNNNIKIQKKKLNLLEHPNEFPLMLIRPDFKHTLNQYDLNQMFNYEYSLITKNQLEVKDNLSVIPISILGGNKTGKSTFINYFLKASSYEMPNIKDLNSIFLNIFSEDKVMDNNQLLNQFGIKVHGTPNRYSCLGGGPILLECQSLSNLELMINLQYQKEIISKSLSLSQLLSLREAQILAFASIISKFILIFIDGSTDEIDLSTLIDFIQEHNKKVLWWKEYKHALFPEQIHNQPTSYLDLKPIFNSKKYIIIVINNFDCSLNNVNKRIQLENRIEDLLTTLNYNHNLPFSFEFEYKGLKMDPNLRGNLPTLMNFGKESNLNIVYLPNFGGNHGFLNYHLTILRLRRLLFNNENIELDNVKNKFNNFPAFNERKWLSYSFLVWESIMSNQDTLIRSY